MGQGYYDNSGIIDMGEIYHGVTYPDEGWDNATRSGIYRRKWHCIMENGLIRFIKPEECSAEFVRSAGIKRFGENNILTGVGAGACAFTEDRFSGADIGERR